MHLPHLLLLLLPPTLSARTPQDAVLLSSVTSLTFHANRLTTSRRLSPIPQLTCTSAPQICSLAPLQVLRCQNTGSSYTPESIEWSCTASLPDTVQLTTTEVICEGYSSPTDPFILAGSCAVEYALELTARGRELHPNVQPLGHLGQILFFMLFFGILALIICANCTTSPYLHRGPRRWGPGGPWGPDGYGGPAGGWGPPPGDGKSGSGSGSGSGFWTGLATGAAAGYMAGRNPRRDDYYGGRGWGGQNMRTERMRGADNHETTGFGGTRRR